MKRIWDIVDQISPGFEVTRRTEKGVNLAAASKKVTLLVAASLIIASATSFCISVPQMKAPIGMQKKEPGSAPARTRVAGTAPDTAVAMSGRKLAEAFSAHFQPA